ncbi:MAG TPA: hypothetical protein VHU24_04970 [Solirubrobacterales bacterium]|nr:hypothetical protein [Solirubrobacterales bacterium]
MRSRGIVRVGVALLVLPLLLGVATADAKKKHKKPKSPPVTSVSATRMTSADNQQVTTTATCPSGLIAVGGGFQSPAVLDAGSPTDLNLVYESRRAGDGAWQASAVREDTGSPGPDLPVTAIVDCRSTKLASKKPSGKKATAAKKKRKKRLRIIEATASAVAAPVDAAQASATATCPAKTTALGGGFSSSPTPVAVEPEAFPYPWSNHRTTPTSWLAALSNVGTVSRTITSYAYCAAGLKIAETTAAVPLPASGQTVTSATATSPPCPKGKALLGGGFNNTPASESSALAQLTGFSPANGSWQLGTLNFNQAPGTISSSGYCA